MNLNQVINTESTSIPTKQSRFFDYKKMPYDVFAFEGDILYGADENLQVFKSTDGGKTWGRTRIGTLPASVAKAGGTYHNGAVTVWLTSKKVIRTTDDFATTLTVLTDINNPITPNGIARSVRDPNKIMFCEYVALPESSTNATPLRVFFSADNGATWKVVMTKNNPTDIRHFHSVDFINGDDNRLEWIVTSGDGHNNGFSIKWFRSVDDGATWTQIFGDTKNADGAQMFRTLGIAKIQPNTYVWTCDSFEENYVFACRADDLKPENVVKVQALGSHSWGIKGGKHWLVTCDKVESTTFNGQYLNRIYVSGDGMATMFKEYEFESTEYIEGIMGVQGPDAKGRFYVRVNSPDNKTIQMTPRKELIYPSKPINQNKILVEHKQVLIKGVMPTKDSSVAVDPLKKSVYEPLLVVSNRTNVDIAVVLFDMSNGTYALADLESGLMVSKTIGAGKTVMLGQGDQLIRHMIPRGTKVSVRALTADATSGEVIMTLYGKSYKVADHRAL